MSDYLVQFNNISKFFGKVIALKDVTMKLRKGEIMCLLGDNGAGKSTLIKTLAGVHKPDKGEIIFEGEKIIFDYNTPIEKLTKKLKIPLNKVAIELNKKIMDKKKLKKVKLNNGDKIEIVHFIGGG